MSTQNEPKILTPEGALRALADGKKLRHHSWEGSHFIYLIGGRLVQNWKNGGFNHGLGNSLEGYTLYVPPKIKKAFEVVRWVNVYKSGMGHTFETEESAKKNQRGNEILIERVRCVGSYTIEVEEGEV